MENTGTEVEFFDVCLLNKKEYEEYDVERSLYNVTKFITRYKRLKSKHYMDIPIKITKQFKFIYVDESYSSSNSYNKIDKHIDDDNEYKQLSIKITKVTETMNLEERIFFTMHFMNNESMYLILQKLGCSKNGISPIRNSCIMKLAWAFDLEVELGNKLPDEDEIKFNGSL